jgi:nitroreductase
MVISLIRKRRSIRKFLDKPIEAEKIDLLIEAARPLPGILILEFVAVTNRAIAKLSSQTTARPF